MMCNIDDREDDHENQDKAIDQFETLKMTEVII